MTAKAEAKTLANGVSIPEPVDDSGRSSHSGIQVTNKATEKQIIRKIDWWLVGFYSAVYIFRVIDSANYSNAAIINLENGTGIKKQLRLDASQWAWTLSIFSYSYLIFEPPNTLLLKTFRPSRWMFVLILGWGISACSSSAVMDFKGMMCARFAIGLAEAGFFPAVLYHVVWLESRNALIVVAADQKNQSAS
ncbi:hypothetical protein PFICI_10715 [Pestalotiopsis fici W106-1]|uniref:Major facilitator superfamily (MFS) profile domain-containing protein n=1 Tax=Pestalotiopsis fici (strain W106-1 / CGMCC3.15140) TaxID=1229662 RepID=W3WVH6_PESFW|nr:uncharacterized protein PFICI_10715 [Pestalotiopsis fici W106-1]ETS76841.1 hypothetical protein PFICI_10715 [Pestalotiopsis fici W106-1]